jgi:hypothetical protein
VKIFVKTVLILCVVLLSQQSCKVGYSFNGASIPADAKTVSVLYFSNNSALAPPTISQQFTEALKDICSSQTKLALVTKGGDLNFEGNISDYRVAPVAIQTNDQTALNRLTISVLVKYSNKLDEKKNFEATFSRYADFAGTESLASKEQDQEFMKQIYRQLTEDIFNKAFNNW